MEPGLRRPRTSEAWSRGLAPGLLALLAEILTGLPKCPDRGTDPDPL